MDDHHGVSAIGFWIAPAAVGDALSALPSTYDLESGQLVSTMNLERQATAYVFFAYLSIFTIAGLLVMCSTRNPHASHCRGWFAFLVKQRLQPKEHAIGHCFGRLDFGFRRFLDTLALWVLSTNCQTEEGYHVTSVNGGCHRCYGLVAGMVAERWYTRAMLVGSMWAQIKSLLGSKSAYGTTRILTVHGAH